MAFAQGTSDPLKPTINFQVIEQKRINLGDHSLFMNRVVPPILPPTPAPASPTSPILTTEQKQAFAEREAKRSVILFLSVTVYDRQITELRWWDESGSHRVFSNIDFNYVAGIGGFETPDTSYTLMMGLGNESRADRIQYNGSLTKDDLKNNLQLDAPPLATDFSATRSEYMVAEDKAHPSPTREDLAALDALHAYFDSNKQRLIDDYAKREAANAARQQYLKDHPPVPQDTVINYWFGQGDTTTLQKPNTGGRP